MNSRKIDLFIGALEENLITNGSLIASSSYYYDEIRWCIPKPKPLPLWNAILHICTDPIVFIAFSLHAIFITAGCYFIQQFEHHQKWDLYRISVNGIRCYAGYGCPYKPKNNANRLGAAGVFLGSFLFNIILCTKITMLSTTPIHDAQLKSITTAIDNGFQLVGDRFVYQKILQQNQVLKFKM